MTISLLQLCQAVEAMLLELRQRADVQRGTVSEPEARGPMTTQKDN